MKPIILKLTKSLEKWSKKVPSTLHFPLSSFIVKPIGGLKRYLGVAYCNTQKQLREGLAETKTGLDAPHWEHTVDWTHN